jgi:4a-hydroxytetrahydrobiopterin dehydratase
MLVEVILTYKSMKSQLTDIWHADHTFGLSKVFAFDSFEQAMSFINAVADLAKKHNHHPDIRLYEGSNVDITLYSYDEFSITDKDYTLSEAIDGISF